MTQNLVAMIHDKFKEGISGIYVVPEEVIDNEVPGVYVLGHYHRGGYYEPSIDIYYGSFQKVFEGLNREQLQHELWETIVHEIRHHLEENAGLKDLRNFDQQKLNYYKLSRNTSHEAAKSLPTYPVLNRKHVGNRLLGDLILEPSEAPHKIKVNLSSTVEKRKLLLIDFPKGITIGQTVKLNLSDRVREADATTAYFEVRPVRKYTKIRTLSGDFWHLFEPVNLSKKEICQKKKLSNHNYSCMVQATNYKNIEGFTYFDIFLNMRMVKNCLNVYIPDFIAGRDGLLIRLKTEDLKKQQNLLSKRISSITVKNSDTPHDVYFTFHFFK